MASLLLNTDTNPGTATWTEADLLLFKSGIKVFEFPSGLNSLTAESAIAPIFGEVGQEVMVGWYYLNDPPTWVEPATEVMVTARVVNSTTIRITVFNPFANITDPFRVFVNYSMLIG